MSAVYTRTQEFLKLKNLRGGTQYRYLRSLKRFEDFLASRSLEEATRSDVVDFLSSLRDGGLSPSTLKGHQSALIFVFKVVLDRPEVTRNIPWPKVVSALPDIWTPAEVSRLFEAIVDSRYRTFAMALYGTGMRISELCTLRISKIDGPGRMIHIDDGKGGKSRTIPLSEELRYQLRSYYRLVRPTGPYLFPGHQGAAHVSGKTIRKALHVAAERTGIEKKMTPHSLRHCYATALLEHGTDLRTIQHILGHSSLQMTSRYLHMTTSHLANVASPLALLGLPAGNGRVH